MAVTSSARPGHHRPDKASIAWEPVSHRARMGVERIGGLANETVFYKSPPSSASRSRRWT